MSPPVRLAIAGALGRMGVAVAKVVEGRPDLVVAARFDRIVGEGLVDRAAALGLADVVIDFTTAEASAALASEAAALKNGPALVIGSTGFDPAQDASVRRAAEKIVVVRSGNFSLGVNVLVGLAARAAAALPGDAYDAEVFEAHHRRKIDAPSGTGLMLGEAIASGRGQNLEDAAVRVRDGITGPRAVGSIGFSVMRGGGIVGEHSVVFAAEDEILTISHSARDRSLFARGAVAAALWARARAPGLYDMQDVLGFR